MQLGETQKPPFGVTWVASMDEGGREKEAVPVYEGFVPQHLVKRLEALGLWTDEVRTSIVAANGSVQGVPSIPATMRSMRPKPISLSRRGAACLPKASISPNAISTMRC